MTGSSNGGHFRGSETLNGSSQRGIKNPLDSRYSRQIALREFGLPAQQKLGSARVVIVGAGGLGSPAAMYLAAAGVGTLGLVDSDSVDESNLHRQLLYTSKDIGADKLTAAAAKLADINPMVDVVLHREKLSSVTARELMSGYDIVLDGTDNFPARYAINDACIALGIPFVYGSVARFEGQVSLFAAPGGPCYRCLFPSMPPDDTVPNCAQDGVLGVVPGIIGLHQSTEVIKWVTGLGRPLVGRLLMLDLLDHSYHEVEFARDAMCPACGDQRTFVNSDHGKTPVRGSDTLDNTSASESTAESNHHSRVMTTAPEIDVATVAARLKAGEQLVLLDVREPWEYEIAHLPYASLVPLSTLPSALANLDSEKEFIVYCHHGMRSAMAANWLISQGFLHVSNMTGGIDAWSAAVDPSVPQY